MIVSQDFIAAGLIGWWWAMVGAAAGVFFFYTGFGKLQRRRLILNTPTSKVRSAAIGLVELSGLATGTYTLNAPITGVPCYYYQTKAWQRDESANNGKWELVAEESLHLPFFLEDTTGRMLVDPEGADLELHRDYREEFGNSALARSMNLPANVAGFLMRNGVRTDRSVRVEERCIRPKNPLFILGTLAANPGITVAPAPVRDQAETELASPPKLIRLPGAEKPAVSATMSQQEKIAAALTKAGITSPSAWQAAGLSEPSVTVKAVSAGAAAAAAPALEFDPNQKTVLMKGTQQPEFLISWRSQREIVGELGWKAALMIWGGPALTLLSVYVLMQHFC